MKKTNIRYCCFPIDVCVCVLAIFIHLYRLSSHMEFAFLCRNSEHSYSHCYFFFLARFTEKKTLFIYLNKKKEERGRESGGICWFYLCAYLL